MTIILVLNASPSIVAQPAEPPATAGRNPPDTRGRFFSYRLKGTVLAREDGTEGRSFRTASGHGERPGALSNAGPSYLQVHFLGCLTFAAPPTLSTLTLPSART